MARAFNTSDEGTALNRCNSADVGVPLNKASLALTKSEGVPVMSDVPEGVTDRSSCSCFATASAGVTEPLIEVKNMSAEGVSDRWV